jgi:hypothetical protein
MNHFFVCSIRLPELRATYCLLIKPFEIEICSKDVLILDDAVCRVPRDLARDDMKGPLNLVDFPQVSPHLAPRIWGCQTL